MKFEAAGKLGSVRTVWNHPAFRRDRVRASARIVLWAAHCAAGRPATITLGRNGARLRLPPNLLHGGSGGVFVLRERYEPEVGWLERTLTPGMVFIDGGANLGIYTVLASSLVGSEGAVVAFEPGATSFERLRRNVELNGAANVHPVNKALSDHSGRAKLFHGDGGPVGYSLNAENTTANEFEEVEITTIDDTLADVGVGHVDVIKLDVEGEEERALQGALKTLERDRPMIMFEYLPNTTVSEGLTREGAWKLLEGLNYGFWAATDDGQLVPLSQPQLGNNIAIAR